MKRITPLSILMFSLLILQGCGDIKKEAKYPTGANRAVTQDIYAKPESIFGKDGVSLFSNKKDDKEDGASGIGVNTYLWRAALDTVSFMPLASADPFGGVILTDWYSPEGTDKERIKLNVFIMDGKLRADGIRVRMFKQTMTKKGWKDAEASAEAARKLEDTILTRARQMRVAKIED